MQVLSLSRPDTPPRPLERRRHQRVRVALLGRYMLVGNAQEYPCQSVDFSPGGVALIAALRGEIGQRVIIYFEHIGRIEGQIVRYIANGFAVALHATIHKRDKLASQLTWLANRHALGLPEDRRHERIIPRVPGTSLKLPDGREFSARIIDISLSGAGVSCDLKPLVGSHVVLGRTSGKVVRYFPGGFGIEFMMPISPERFDENIVV
jgi:hypothetical protein